MYQDGHQVGYMSYSLTSVRATFKIVILLICFLFLCKHRLPILDQKWMESHWVYGVLLVNAI